MKSKILWRKSEYINVKRPKRASVGGAADCDFKNGKMFSFKKMTLGHRLQNELFMWLSGERIFY